MIINYENVGIGYSLPFFCFNTSYSSTSPIELSECTWQWAKLPHAQNPAFYVTGVNRDDGNRVCKRKGNCTYNHKCGNQGCSFPSEKENIKILCPYFTCLGQILNLVTIS